MEANKPIERTLEVMKSLPIEAQKEVSDFAEKVLARLEEKMMIQGMMELQNRSPRVFDFLDDGEIYTEKDAIARYDD